MTKIEDANIESTNVESDRRFSASWIIDQAKNPKALFILAHGAGADMNHRFFQQIVPMLNKQKISVLRFNFPFMIKRAEDGKRRPPDRMPKLKESYVEFLQSIEGLDVANLPIFIGGKSMGGRVAATVCSECDEKTIAAIKGVICLGYPFHVAKKPEKLRLEPIQQAKKALLVVQGERDLMGNEQEVNEYQLSKQCQLIFLPDGDHDLKPRVRSGFTQEQHLHSAVSAISRFIDENS